MKQLRIRSAECNVEVKEYVVRSSETGGRSAFIRFADWVVVSLVGIGIVLLIFLFILRPVQVDSPQVKELSDGELVLVDRLSRYITGFDRGDAVRAKLNNSYGMYRVVALGGERFTVQDGNTYIDGCLLDESPYSNGWDEGVYIDIDIPEGNILVLPDSRFGLSAESVWSIPLSDVYGELRVRIFPMSRMDLYS